MVSLLIWKKLSVWHLQKYIAILQYMLCWYIDHADRHINSNQPTASKRCFKPASSAWGASGTCWFQPTFLPNWFPSNDRGELKATHEAWRHRHRVPKATGAFEGGTLDTYMMENIGNDRSHKLGSLARNPIILSISHRPSRVAVQVRPILAPIEQLRLVGWLKIKKVCVAFNTMKIIKFIQDLLHLAQGLNTHFIWFCWLLIQIIDMLYHIKLVTGCPRVIWANQELILSCNLIITYYNI